MTPAASKQLQRKFKHTSDFGISGSYNSANARNFNRAIQQHVNSAATKQIQGTYRGNPVTFHVNPNTGLMVVQRSNGGFVSGWKLSGDQLKNVLTRGKL